MIGITPSTVDGQSPEISRENILNYLNHNLEQGNELGLFDGLFTLDSYDLLEVTIPNRTQIIETLNSMQSTEGTWVTGQNHYVPITAQLLMFYNRSGVKPTTSLDPFFSTIDTWEKVNDHVNNYDPTNYWGGLWGYVNCYIVYKGESPPWTSEFVAKANADFDIWAYNNHQRTHLIPNLLQLGKPVPRLDEAVNIMLQQQKSDGSWDWAVSQTGFAIPVLNILKSQTTVNPNLIDAAVSKGLEYIKQCYREIVVNGQTYAGFARDSSSLSIDAASTAEGIWVLLNPQSDIWSRWFITNTTSPTPTPTNTTSPTPTPTSTPTSTPTTSPTPSPSSSSLPSSTPTSTSTPDRPEFSSNVLLIFLLIIVLVSLPIVAKFLVFLKRTRASKTADGHQVN